MHEPSLEDARQGWGAVLAVKCESPICRRPLLCMKLQHDFMPALLNLTCGVIDS